MSKSTPTFIYDYTPGRENLRLVGYRGGKKQTYARRAFNGRPAPEELSAAVHSMHLEAGWTVGEVEQIKGEPK